MAATSQIPTTDRPSKDECTFAMLAHVLQLFGSFIAPLVIYIAKRDSAFVRFHALQALLWKIVEMVVMFLVFIVFFAGMVATIVASAPSKQPPIGIFLFMPLIWGGVLFSWVINITIAIYFGIKSYDGQWAAYPLIGRLARKWAGIA